MSNLTSIQTQLSKRYLYILYLSFLPFFIKGVTYLFLGSGYFILLSFIIIGTIVYKIHVATSKSLKIIKVWSLLLISYGIIRFLLASLNLFMNSIESTIVYQLTFWYHLQSVLFLFLGRFLFVNRTKIELRI